MADWQQWATKNPHPETLEFQADEAWNLASEWFENWGMDLGEFPNAWRKPGDWWSTVYEFRVDNERHHLLVIVDIDTDPPRKPCKVTFTQTNQ